MKKIFTSEKEAREADAFCFDCQSKKDLSLAVYEEDGKELFVFKCEKCLENNPSLSEYKECEVYSRIVGYLRPVKQWNDGKRQEYSERKEYVA